MYISNLNQLSKVEHSEHSVHGSNHTAWESVCWKIFNLQNSRNQITRGKDTNLYWNNCTFLSVYFHRYHCNRAWFPKNHMPHKQRGRKTSENKDLSQSTRKQFVWIPRKLFLYFSAKHLILFWELMKRINWLDQLVQDWAKQCCKEI